MKDRKFQVPECVFLVFMHMDNQSVLAGHIWQNQERTKGSDTLTDVGISFLDVMKL